MSSINENLDWKIITSHVPFTGKHFKIREDKILLPSQKTQISYAYMERAAGVVIIPVMSSGSIVLIHQYRLPVNEWCLEVPAGSTGDTGDMPLEDVVRKELKEEIGATAERIEHVSQFFSAPAYSSEINIVFIAWGVELTSEPKTEPTEKIKREIVSAAEAVQRAENGQLNSAASALALCRARKILSNAGLL